LIDGLYIEFVVEILKKEKMGNSKNKSNKKKEKNETPLSVLLLGAGESGKSTIFKQMKIIHHKGYSQEEKENYKPIIYRNIVEAMMSLIQASLKLGIAIKKPENRVELFYKIKERAHKINNIKKNDLSSIENVWNKKLSDDIMELWADKGIQATYEERAQFQLDDCAKYYLDDLARISEDEYSPTTQDVLRARVRTGGSVAECTFKVTDREVK
jgi:hypothetical protein